ncbi:TIGR01459 family HAD-type hydrolase [Maridesulfovibrio frigidus]|uniref:TIGR01459 family HAD-type hydrolase n=1 Tax=Maridesulfovibrio frigidus TaxID=340956 RepID=UPI00068B6349|nr:TIGR01459 family HAD-type hydrolase [Maridesulfovibrio frigidus]
MKTYSGIAEMVDDYQAFILDVWGVLHDGFNPYPGAVDGLRRMRNLNCPVTLISNTPSTESVLAQELQNIGFSPDLYDSLFTSGTLTREAVKDGEDIGKNYMHIGPEIRAGLIDGLGFKRVDLLNEAHFLLVTGLNDEQQNIASYTEQLACAARNSLPMYCANPDLSISHIDGSQTPCAGSLALAYEELGGVVHKFGKPYPMIFERALSCFPEKQKIALAVVGDSLSTDIRGAKNAGLPAILITSGVAATQAGGSDLTKIINLCKQENLKPDAILEYFSWKKEDR